MVVDFADAAFAVDGALTQFSHGVISLICQSICEGIVRVAPPLLHVACQVDWQALID